MSLSTLPLTGALQDYILKTTLRESALLARLRSETAALPEAEMQIAPEQGQFMALLTRLTGARRALEVGTFTGYSSLCVALALPAEGRLVACDASKEWTDIARRYWQEAGVAGRVELRLGPAKDSLDALLAAGEQESFDLAFIDADKPSYDVYYERALQLLRPGGLIMIDNVLRHGEVADAACMEKGTVAIRELNQKIGKDARVDASLVPIGDGLMLVRKREGKNESRGEGGSGGGEDLYTLRI